MSYTVEVRTDVDRLEEGRSRTAPLPTREGWQPLADVDNDATLMGKHLTTCR